MHEILCELCGRAKGNGENWLKGEASNSKVTILMPEQSQEDSRLFFDICGERCAAEFVAVWVSEQSQRASQREKDQQK